MGERVLRRTQAAVVSLALPSLRGRLLASPHALAMQCYVGSQAPETIGHAQPGMAHAYYYQNDHVAHPVADAPSALKQTELLLRVSLWDTETHVYV